MTKKLLCFGVALLSAISLVGCSNTESQVVEATVYKKEQDRIITILEYNGYYDDTFNKVIYKDVPVGSKIKAIKKVHKNENGRIYDIELLIP